MKMGRPKKGKEPGKDSPQVWTRLPQEVIDLIPEPRAATIRLWILEKLLERQKEREKDGIK